MGAMIYVREIIRVQRLKDHRSSIKPQLVISLFRQLRPFVVVFKWKYHEPLFTKRQHFSLV